MTHQCFISLNRKETGAQPRFGNTDTSRTGIPDTEPLHTIEEVVEGLRDTLWPLNRYIHDNAELAFEEFKTQNALTKFMRSQEDWHVTMSA
jgi:hypothetical protein